MPTEISTIDYNSISDIKKLLNRHDLAVRKKWGQNFLINEGVRLKLRNLLKMEPGDNLWEIGPGVGNMTVEFLAEKNTISLFEIDPGYCKILSEIIPEERRTIYTGDFIKTIDSGLEAGVPDKVFGNLPYNSASSIIREFINKRVFPKKMVFTVQEEGADRMVATPSTSNYSSFSVFVQSAFKVIKIGRIAPGSFYPVPGVNSAIVVFEPAPGFSEIKDQALFFHLVHSLFLNRRKTLRNNIKNCLRDKGVELGLTKELLEEAFGSLGIDLTRRPETLSIDDFKALANSIKR